MQVINSDYIIKNDKGYYIDAWDDELGCEVFKLGEEFVFFWGDSWIVGVVDDEEELKYECCKIKLI